ncbi:hypothetical protein CYMTET_32977 [Cymbomonas tetramitiformis]|uniref:Uncharacterized protein n=1 Tax=Cymbomonas tetramitiformis TaxID=36881 RepID=A0AAE0KRE9_9CHLO|nr:hypothetical protein CYMTET_32977 [Cymbomonas tetramitiformis]
MQKVLEAMGLVEEARGANMHLPPHVPNADDVKKLSDHSRAQKLLLSSTLRIGFGWLDTWGHLGVHGFCRSRGRGGPAPLAQLQRADRAVTEALE